MCVLTGTAWVRQWGHKLARSEWTCTESMVCVCVCVCVLGQHNLSPQQETHVPRVVTKPNLYLPLTQRLWLGKVQCLFQGTKQREQVANAK